MSLNDTLLSQQLVVLSIALAGVLLMTAIALTLLPGIQAARQRRVRRRIAEAQKAEQEKLRQAEAAQTELAATATPTAPAKDEKSTSSSASTPATANKAPAPASPAASTPQTAPAASSETPSEEQASPEMQNLLASVFASEESSERQGILMRGMSEVTINDLLTLTENVSRRLHGEQAIQRVEIPQIVSPEKG